MEKLLYIVLDLARNHILQTHVVSAQEHCSSYGLGEPRFLRKEMEVLHPTTLLVPMTLSTNQSRPEVKTIQRVPTYFSNHTPLFP